MAGKTAEAQDPVLSAVVQRIDSNLVGYTLSLFHVSASPIADVMFVVELCVFVSCRKP